MTNKGQPPCCSTIWRWWCLLVCAPSSQGLQNSSQCFSMSVFVSTPRLFLFWVSLLLVVSTFQWGYWPLLSSVDDIGTSVLRVGAMGMFSGCLSVCNRVHGKTHQCISWSLSSSSSRGFFHFPDFNSEPLLENLPWLVIPPIAGSYSTRQFFIPVFTIVAISHICVIICWLTLSVIGL